jgi:hypothetical protein
MSDHDITSRLRLYKYDKDAYEAAIHGEKITHALGFLLPHHCIIRGIRYYHSSGEELRDIRLEFTRALNAMLNGLEVDKDLYI